MKPHKHAELIKQWAEDPTKKVWMRLNEKDLVWEESHIVDVINDISSSYIYCVGSPKKLTPVVRWLWAWHNLQSWTLTDFYTEDEIAKQGYDVSRMICLEFTRTEFPE